MHSQFTNESETHECGPSFSNGTARPRPLPAWGGQETTVSDCSLLIFYHSWKVHNGLFVQEVQWLVVEKVSEEATIKFIRLFKQTRSAVIPMKVSPCPVLVLYRGSRYTQLLTRGVKVVASCVTNSRVWMTSHHKATEEEFPSPHKKRQKRTAFPWSGNSNSCESNLCSTREWNGHYSDSATTNTGTMAFRGAASMVSSSPDRDGTVFAMHPSPGNFESRPSWGNLLSMASPPYTKVIYPYLYYRSRMY